jgi:hypothetical protein
MFHCGTDQLLFYFHEVSTDLFYISDVVLKTILDFLFIELDIPLYKDLFSDILDKMIAYTMA